MLRARREHYRDRRGRTAVMISMPALLGLLAFVVAPFLLAVVLGFSNLRLGSPLPLEWVGLEQYRRIFADPSFTRAVFNNLLFALVVVPLQTALALVL
ncbi:MAG: sugar ABC transporter permease, partial [Chromatiaceae bacterium]